jgi:hypothetical protein
MFSSSCYPLIVVLFFYVMTPWIHPRAYNARGNPVAGGYKKYHQEMTLEIQLFFFTDATDGRINFPAAVAWRGSCSSHRRKWCSGDCAGKIHRLLSHWQTEFGKHRHTYCRRCGADCRHCPDHNRFVPAIPANRSETSARAFAFRNYAEIIRRAIQRQSRGGTPLCSGTMHRR